MAEREAPTPEEIMTPTQRDLSKKWEKGAGLRKRHQELDPREETDSSGNDALSITDKGHEIRLRRYKISDEEFGYQAVIDGELMNFKGDKEGMEMAHRLWDKYSSEVQGTAHGFDASEKDIARARREVAQQGIDTAMQEGTKSDVARAVAVELLSEKS